MCFIFRSPGQSGGQSHSAHSSSSVMRHTAQRGSVVCWLVGGSWVEYVQYDKVLVGLRVNTPTISHDAFISVCRSRECSLTHFGCSWAFLLSSKSFRRTGRQNFNIFLLCYSPSNSFCCFSCPSFLSLPFSLAHHEVQEFSSAERCMEGKSDNAKTVMKARVDLYTWLHHLHTLDVFLTHTDGLYEVRFLCSWTK